MKTRITTCAVILALAATFYAGAKQTVWFHTAENHQLGIETELFDSISPAAEGGYAVTTKTGAVTAVNGTLQRMTFADNNSKTVVIDFDATPVRVVNPLAFEGVNVVVSDKAVTVTSTTDADVEYTLSGTGTAFKLYSQTATVLNLDGVTLTNPAGAAINIQSKKATDINLGAGKTNTLADGATYATPDGEKENGTLFALGNINIAGDGTLNVSAACKHAIASSKAISVKGGTVNVTSAASDGLHADGITVSGGIVTTVNTAGDGIDAGKEQFVMTGGKADVTIAADDVKGIKADGDINVTGGEIVLNVSSAQGKGLKTKANCTFDGVQLTANMSGDAVVVDYDPSYCTAVKVDGNFTMNSGNVKVVSTGKAGKGFSVDGNAVFNDGNIDITVSGDGDVYTDSLGVKDSYSATCITVDGNLELLGGTFTLSSSGTAGKCLKSDLEMVIGTADKGPVITAKTTGAKFLVDAGTSQQFAPGGGGPGGNPGGGPGGGPGGMDNADYANPKVVKAEGNLTVNNGKLTLTSTQDGGEGLESKSTMTINGGDIHITTVDDCINTKTHLQINGGIVRCVATGNDAIDSNGTITITGGVVIAAGASTPEGSLDCDQNTFAVTGGYVFGIGGDCSSPTTAQVTQPVAMYSGSFSKNQRINVADAQGNCLLSLVNPASGNSGRIIFTSPKMTQGSSVTVSTGGTVTGGTTAYELTYDGKLSGATTKTTLTLSSMVTGSTGGGRPW